MVKKNVDSSSTDLNILLCHEASLLKRNLDNVTIVTVGLKNYT